MENIPMSTLCKLKIEEYKNLKEQKLEEKDAKEYIEELEELIIKIVPQLFDEEIEALNSKIKIFVKEEESMHFTIKGYDLTFEENNIPIMYLINSRTMLFEKYKIEDGMTLFPKIIHKLDMKLLNTILKKDFERIKTTCGYEVKGFPYEEMPK